MIKAIPNRMQNAAIDMEIISIKGRERLFLVVLEVLEGTERVTEVDFFLPEQFF